LFSQHALDVMHERGISRIWVLDTLKSPSVKMSITDNEEHYFKQIGDAENRCLKVVYNPEFRRVVTAYFDRNMRKKGCQ